MVRQSHPPDHKINVPHKAQMVKRKLHIGLVAMACSPYQGSEAGLAWKSILVLSSIHRLTVFTHRKHQIDCEHYLNSPDIAPALSNVQFIYVGKDYNYHRNQAIARLLNWHYYRLWLSDCVTAINQSHRQDRMDLVHHVTYSTWRMGSPFYKIGIPTVWGPIGGAGRVPFSVYGTLSLEAKVVEALRSLISIAYSLTPAFRRSLNRNSVVLASNRETQIFLGKISHRQAEIVFPTYFEAGEQQSQSAPPSENEPLKCFYGGGIIGSKGITLSLAAIALAVKNGTDICFKIAGTGPEVAFLEKMATSLGLERRVTLLPLLKGEDYQKVLSECDVFLFPSFRENIGITMVDAMLHESAPIVLDTSAPGEIVTADCGWKIPLDSTRIMVENIAAALIEANADRSQLRKKGRAARERILKAYSKKRYLDQIGKSYAQVLSLQIDCDQHSQEFD